MGSCINRSKKLFISSEEEELEYLIFKRKIEQKKNILFKPNRSILLEFKELRKNNKLLYSINKKKNNNENNDRNSNYTLNRSYLSSHCTVEDVSENIIEENHNYNLCVELLSLNIPSFNKTIDNYDLFLKITFREKILFISDLHYYEKTKAFIIKRLRLGNGLDLNTFYYNNFSSSSVEYICIDLINKQENTYLSYCKLPIFGINNYQIVNSCKNIVFENKITIKFNFSFAFLDVVLKLESIDEGFNTMKEDNYLNKKVNLQDYYNRKFNNYSYTNELLMITDFSSSFLLHIFKISNITKKKLFTIQSYINELINQDDSEIVENEFINYLENHELKLYSFINYFLIFYIK